MEKSKEELKCQNKKLRERLKLTEEVGKSEEIENYKIEIEQLTKLLKSYEDQNLKKSELERKLRIINSKHEKEIKTVENSYREVRFK